MDWGDADDSEGQWGAGASTGGWGDVATTSNPLGGVDDDDGARKGARAGLPLSHPLTPPPYNKRFSL